VPRFASKPTTPSITTTSPSSGRTRSRR
jgi:hypothetical protein